MNAIIEHQYSSKTALAPVVGYLAYISTGNPHFILAVIRSKKRFEALRNFTLKSGQAEIERLNERRKAASSEPGSPASPARVLRTSSMDGARSPASTRTPTLSNVPEESTAFAIGEDDDSDDDDYHQPTPSQSSPSRQNSRTPSVSSSVDVSVEDAVPMQLRGMSEKARGKMPAGQPSFSRQNSTTSLNSHSATVFSTGTDFAPSSDWVRVTAAHRYGFADMSLLDRNLVTRTTFTYHPHPHIGAFLETFSTWRKLARFSVLAGHHTTNSNPRY